MKKLMFAVFCVMLVSMNSFLSAKEEAISRGMNVEEVENAKPGFYVRLSVDHKDHIYKEGDLLCAKVKSSADGYLYLLYQNVDKEVALLYPNNFHKDNKISKGETVSVPEEGSSFRIRTAAPFGEEKLLAVVTKKPLKKVITKQLGEFFTLMDKRFLKTLSKAVMVEASETAQVSPSEWAEHCITIKTVASAESRTTTKPKKNRYMVCIGVGNYKDANIPKLKACPYDAKAMKKFFTERCGVPEENVLIITDEKATLANVKAVFCNGLPKLTKEGDTIFIYWSGHGGRCADEDGDEKDGYDTFLVPYDGKRSDAKNTMLIDDVFGRWVQNLDGRKILFLLDACNSGGNITTKGLEEPFDFGMNELSLIKDIGQRNVAVIASSTSKEVSLVREGGDMSVMTWYILDELKKNSEVTQKTLFKGIKDKVRDYVRENFDLNQNMLMQDDLEDDLIINID